jgi:PKD repeat protein
LYVDSPPIIDVSLDFGTTPVLKRISDNEFIVRPHSKVSFEVSVYQADSDKQLPVLIKTIQNGEIKNIKQNVSKIEVDIGDSGTTVIVFEIIDEARLSSEKKFTFNIQPLKKPDIISFKTESDTIKIMRIVDALFVTTISDQDTVLDSIKFILGYSQIAAKKIQNNDTVYLDSTSIQLFSNAVTTTPMYLIAIDKMGRSDTSSLLIVSNSRGKIGNLVPPSIEKIDIQKQEPDSNLICFHPVVTVYNGDVTKALYSWSFGGDYITTENNPCKKFSVPGTYKVILTVEDQAGAIATDSVEVVIRSLQKTPFKIHKLIATPDSGYAPLKVDFQVNLPSGADPEDVSAVVWRFGDGPSKTGELWEKHTYEWPGDYAVRVKLSSNGGYDTICDTIHVLSYIGYDYMTPVKVGQKTAFWINGFEKQNATVLWMFPDTVFSAKIEDTCYVAFHSDGPNEIIVNIIPDGEEGFVPERLAAIFCIVRRW